MKGKFDKLQNRIAINNASIATVDDRNTIASGEAFYNGKATLGFKDAGKTFTEYFDDHFLDQEYNVLPYKIGSYLRGKKVLNIGASFFMHLNRVVYANNFANLSEKNVSIFAVDFANDSINNLGIEMNSYNIIGHHYKRILKYQNKNFESSNKNILSLKAMIYL